MISTKDGHTMTQISQMSQLLEVVPKSGHHKKSSLSPQDWEVLLPVEVVLQIVSRMSHRESLQKLRCIRCLVSKTWYSATIELNGGNFVASLQQCALQRMRKIWFF
jgi:hypothetical protein